MFVKPYTTLTSLKDNQAEESSTENKLNAGVDAKIGITKSLNADLTLNPDFSNADVDEEVTNISRFNIFLPEQREFFIENADIFSNFGSYGVIPFFSRRIGLHNGEAVPILYGARITGNVTDNLRIGVMNVQTKSEGDIDAQNNTVTAFNYKVFNRSQIKGLFVNRQETGNNLVNDYARNYGGEFTYVSKKGNFNNNILYHSSITDENLNGSYFGIYGNYITKAFASGWRLDIVDKDYQADLGFTPRLFNYDADSGATIKKSYISFNPWIRYTFYTKNKTSNLISRQVRSWNNFYFDEEGMNERENNLAYDLNFKNTAAFTISVKNREVNLRYATNFLGYEFDNLPIDNYNFWQGYISYTSDRRNRFTYNIGANYGDFFNGDLAALNTSGNIRFGYWGNFSLSYEFNKISLPENYGKVDLHLIKFNSLFSFTNKLSFNNTVQYNTQSTNFSIYSRLQWRYSPLSDIFLIYNQNNNTNGFDLRNRSIILKFTYSFTV